MWLKSPVLGVSMEWNLTVTAAITSYVSMSRVSSSGDGRGILNEKENEKYVDVDLDLDLSLSSVKDLIYATKLIITRFCADLSIGVLYNYVFLNFTT